MVWMIPQVIEDHTTGPAATIQWEEKDCKNCQYENATYCSTINNGQPTCVTTTCVQVGGQSRCHYVGQDGYCNSVYEGGGWSCCPIFTSSNFGHCVNKTLRDTCEQDV